MKIGDVIKIMDHDCDSKNPEKCNPSNSTICSIIKEHGNSWKITKINLDPYTSWYNILHTQTHIDPRLNINIGRYTVEFEKAEQIEIIPDINLTEFANPSKKSEIISNIVSDDLNEFANEFEKNTEYHEKAGITDAKEQAEALRKFSEGKMTYADMTRNCG